MFRDCRAILWGGILIILSGCAEPKLTEAGDPIPLLEGNGVAALLPAVPQASSSNFSGGERSEYRVEDPIGTIQPNYMAIPQMLTTPGHVRVRRGPGSRVFLAGSASGNEAISVDNFLLIEVENPDMPSGLSRVVAGSVPMVRWDKVPVENRFRDTPIRAGAVDLTDLIPPCTIRDVSVVAMDYGVVASSDAVYLVVAPKAENPFAAPSGKTDCSGKFSSSGR